MKVKRTKTIIEVTQKELDALKTVVDFLNVLAGEEDISESFKENYSYSSLDFDELIEGLDDVITFLDREKQEEYTINKVNKEEN